MFGAEIEHRLLNVLELNSRCEQCDAIHWYVISLMTQCNICALKLTIFWLNLLHRTKKKQLVVSCVTDAVFFEIGLVHEMVLKVLSLSCCGTSL